MQTEYVDYKQKMSRRYIFRMDREVILRSPQGHVKTLSRQRQGHAKVIQRLYGAMFLWESTDVMEIV